MPSALLVAHPKRPIRVWQYQTLIFADGRLAARIAARLVDRVQWNLCPTSEDGRHFSAAILHEWSSTSRSRDCAVGALALSCANTELCVEPFFRCELGTVVLGEDPGVTQEFREGSSFDDPALAQHDDPIAALHGR